MHSYKPLGINYGSRSYRVTFKITERIKLYFEFYAFINLTKNVMRIFRGFLAHKNIISLR